MPLLYSIPSRNPTLHFARLISLKGPSDIRDLYRPNLCGRDDGRRPIPVKISLRGSRKSIKALLKTSDLRCAQECDRPLPLGGTPQPSGPVRSPACLVQSESCGLRRASSPPSGRQPALVQRVLELGRCALEQTVGCPVHGHHLFGFTHSTA